MKNLSTLFLPLLFLMLVNCASKDNATSQDSQSDIQAGEEKNDVPTALCIWKEVSIREIPSDKGKYLTTVYLGEKVEVLPDTASEKVNDRIYNYQHVKLADGTQGWIRKEFIAINAVAGAFLRDAVIYKRPDLMTSSKKNFTAMDFAAIRSSKDGWAEVTGKRSGDTWFTSGWVKDETLTRDPKDVTFSVLYLKAMEIPDANQRTGEVQNILMTTDLMGSAFYSRINEMYGQPAVESDDASEDVDSTSINQAY